ncbi:WhiB family transcriptional regulator [Streptacidiphilus sp. PAMC 29251]
MRTHQARDQAAKQVCGHCPVREPCLQFALDAREPYGVWGGLTEEERMRRTQNTANAPASIR